MWKSRRSPATDRRTAAFSLIELLIAAACATVVVGALVAMFGSGLSTKRTADQFLDAQQSLRSAAELMTMELRESAGARVVFDDSLINSLNGTGGGNGNAGGNGNGNGGGNGGTDATGSTSSPTVPLSNATVLSLLIPVQETSFTIMQPPNFPSDRGFGNGQRDKTDLVSPNSQGLTCDEVIEGGELLLLHDPQTGETRVVQAEENNPCISENGRPRVRHSRYTNELMWSPTMEITRMDGVWYYIDTADGQPALMRQTWGGEPSVVAYGVTGLSIEYGMANGTYTTEPASAPTNIRFRLQATTAPNPTDRQPRVLSLEQSVFMRQVANCPSCASGTNWQASRTTEAAPPTYDPTTYDPSWTSTPISSGTTTTGNTTTGGTTGGGTGTASGNGNSSTPGNSDSGNSTTTPGNGTDDGATPTPGNRR